MINNTMENLIIAQALLRIIGNNKTTNISMIRAIMMIFTVKIPSPINSISNNIDRSKSSIKRINHNRKLISRKVTRKKIMIKDIVKKVVINKNTNTVRNNNHNSNMKNIRLSPHSSLKY